jgi:integrase/recombinase XerD
MSTEGTTTLDDFMTTDSGDETTEEAQEQHEASPQDDQAKESPSRESLCPNYAEGLEKCRDRLHESKIQELNLEKIGCGHCADYLSEEFGATLAEATARAYSSRLRQYVEFLHENQTTVVNADIHHLKQYFNRLAKLNRAEETISSHRSALTNLYKHISIYTDVESNVKWDHIREKIQPSNYNTPEAREREPLEKSEVKKLYDELDSFRDRLLVQVATELGPRNTDVRSIKISDVDFENKKIELSNTKAGGTYNAPLSDQLQLFLRRWIDHERLAHPQAETTDYLFPSKNGGMLGGSSFREIVKEAADRAGIQDTVQSEAPLSERQKETLGTDKDYIEYHKVTPHTLRHTFNHLLIDAGIPREARSKALDHKSMEVTKEFYDHEESDYGKLMRELFSNRGSLLDE